MSEPASRFYRPELDVLRFLAFLCVFEHHFLYSEYDGLSEFFQRVQEAGAFGVCLFFLLSAYLITSLLWIERAKTGSVHLGAFYLRRILRIWPLYFGFLAFGVVLGLLKHTYRVEPLRLASFLLLAGNWYTGVFGWAANPISPLWSISIEEQFYLVMPSLARSFGQKILIGISVVAMAVSYLTLAWLAMHHATVTTSVWTNSLVQFQFFAAGCILATILEGTFPKFRAWLRFAILVGGFALWMVAAYTGVSSNRVPLSPAQLCLGYVAMLAGTILIFLSFLGMRAAVPKPLKYLGQISYGLYVFHMLVLLCVTWTTHYWNGPVAFGARGVAALLLTTLLATLSYEFFEKPFLRMKSKFTFVKSRD